MFKRRKNVEEKLLKQQNLGASLITYTDPRSVTAEQFKTLRTNIEFAQVDKKLRSILVSSSIPAEGKSTVAANLAVVMGQTDKKILLVDADLRKPNVHRTFRLNNEQGLTTLVANPEMQFNQVVQRSRELNVYFLPSGPIPPNPAEMLSSARMAQLMREFEEYFDLIIYDTPPITAVTDSQILSTRVGGVVLVTRYGYVRREEVRKSKETLDNVNANILGYVMNGQPASSDGGYYAYYGYDAESQAGGE